MNIDLDDNETRALLNVLIEVIDADKYPLSPRVRLLREVLAKFGEIGGLPAELEHKLRRAGPPPAAPRQPPKVYEPPSKGPVQAAVMGSRVKPRAPLSGAVAGGSGRAMPPLAATTWEPRRAGRPSAPAARPAATGVGVSRQGK